MSNSVTETPAAPPETALRHFQAMLAFETDCWDVHESLKDVDPGFVLLDVRSRNAYERGHIAGAVSLPHGEICAERLAGFSPETLFVVYCAGPHCNGANKAAIRLSSLGRPVKMMIGGVTGWQDEEFPLGTSGV